MENKNNFFDHIRSISLRRSSDRWLGGVSGGIAEKLSLPVWLVRLLLVVFTLAVGIGLLVYAFFWMFLPDEATDMIPVEEVTRGNVTGEFIGALVMGIVGLLVASAFFRSLFWLLVIFLIVAAIITIVMNRSNIYVVNQYQGDAGKSTSKGDDSKSAAESGYAGEGKPANADNFQGVHLQAGRFEMKAGSFDGKNQASFSNGNKVYVAKESGEAFSKKLDEDIDEQTNRYQDAYSRKIDEKMQEKMRKKMSSKYEHHQSSKPSSTVAMTMWGLGFLFLSLTILLAKFFVQSDIYVPVIILPFALFLLILGLVCIVVGAKSKRLGGALGLLAWGALIGGLIITNNYTHITRDEYSDWGLNCVSINGSKTSIKCEKTISINRYSDDDGARFELRTNEIGGE